MSTLNNYSSLVIYQDSATSNNPLLREVDWKRSLIGLSVDNPLNQKFQVQPGGSQLIFSGARTTTIDGTTAFTVSINLTNGNLYRFVSTGGTAPGFRTDRGLTLSGDTLAVTVNNNVSATFNLTIDNWSSVVVGDTLFLPSPLSGDAASPFNPLNAGLWQVIGKDPGGAPKNITVVRFPSQTFSGTSESVAVTANSQVQAFSSTGVQVGDTVEITAGFSAVTQGVGSFLVYSVTANRFEVLSTSPLALESGILPGNSGMVFYSNAKRFVRVEADQTCYLQLNGDTGQGVRMVPTLASDILNGFGYFEKWGTCYSLNVVNKSLTSPCNIIFISAA